MIKADESQMYPPPGALKARRCCTSALQSYRTQTRELPNKYAAGHYHQACRGMSGRYNTGAKDKVFYVNLAEIVTQICPSHSIKHRKASHK